MLVFFITEILCSSISKRSKNWSYNKGYSSNNVKEPKPQKIKPKFFRFKYLNRRDLDDERRNLLKNVDFEDKMELFSQIDEPNQNSPIDEKNLVRYVDTKLKFINNNLAKKQRMSRILQKETADYESREAIRKEKQKKKLKRKFFKLK